MNTSKPGSMIAGAAGALLIAALFMPWAEVQGVSRNGWELWTMADVFFLIAGLVAIVAAITGGRIRVFRPDLTLNSATDLLGVVATVLLAWLVFFDFPEGAGRETGAFVALAAAATVMCGAGDYTVLRRGGAQRADQPAPGVTR